jgi:hypothetical protein
MVICTKGRCLEQSKRASEPEVASHACVYVAMIAMNCVCCMMCRPSLSGHESKGFLTSSPGLALTLPTFRDSPQDGAWQGDISPPSYKLTQEEEGNL